MSEKVDSGSEKFVDKQYPVAMVFIAGFLILLGISLSYYFVSHNLEMANFVGTLFGGWVGTIIGFYFRERQVEQLRENLEEERKRTVELTDYIKDKSEKIWKKLEDKI